MREISDRQRTWAVTNLAIMLFGVVVNVAIIATAAYDAIVGRKIGLTAAGYGLFWLFGLHIFLWIGGSIIGSLVRKLSARGDNQ